MLGSQGPTGYHVPNPHQFTAVSAPAVYLGFTVKKLRKKICQRVPRLVERYLQIPLAGTKTRGEIDANHVDGIAKSRGHFTGGIF
jgi:hypothetical protein